MARFLLLLTSILAVAAATLSLQSCKSPPAEPEPRGPATDLVALPDGATMIAKSGSIERAVADWLDEGRDEEAGFALAAGTFEDGSATLSPRALGRTARLAEILKAAPDTRITLRAPDAELGAKRAEALARFLEERGVAKARITIASKTSDRAPAPASVELQIRRTAPAEVASAAS